MAAVADVVRFALARDLTFSLNFFRDNDCQATLPDLQYEEKEMVAGLLEAFAVIEGMLPVERARLGPRPRPAARPAPTFLRSGRRLRRRRPEPQIAQCHMDLGTTLGDIRTTDPVRAVRSGSAPIRNLLVDDKEGCRTCSWRNWCAGGCAVATFRATGRFDVRSPNCGIYKAIYPEALRLEGRRLLAYANRP